MSIAKISRALRAMHEDQRGVALPTVMIFMFAGVLLSLVVASTVLQAYSFTSSTRATVQSQAAAEAGIAAARATLLNDKCNDTAGLVSSAAGQPEFSVQIYRPSGTGSWVPGCPTMAEEARIVATGTAASLGAAHDSSGDTIQVETILGSIFSETTLAATGPAVFAYASSGAGGGGKLVSLDGNNVDVMLHTGNVKCDGGFSGAANVVVKSGNFEAVGGCNLAGNVWVNGNITITGGAKIGGSLSGVNINISNGTVGGNAWADEVLTSTGGSIGGWASGKSIVMGGGSLGNAWTRQGGVAMTGGTFRGTVTANGGSAATGGNPANGSITSTNGNFQGAVVASGAVSTSISAPAGIQAGGDVSVSNGTTTGVTAPGRLTITGGTVNGATHVGGLYMTGGNLAGAQVAGAGCFTASGSISASVKVGSITVGGPASCKAKGDPAWWWSGNGPITVASAGSPAAPVLSPSPLKPSPVAVPEWVDFGSKAGHYTAATWGGYSVWVTGATCGPNEIWKALNYFGTSPGLIDARACTDGIVLTGSGTEYTGPFAWGDDTTRNGFTFKNDVTIIANKFDLRGSGRFEGAGTESQLWLINPDVVGNSIPDCSAGQNLSIDGGFSFPKLRTMIYSPCTITIGSSTKLKGQIFAGKTNIAGGATVTYAPLGLPGYNLDTGEETSVVATEWDRPIVSQRNI